jgi:hypothetical protein
VRNFSLRISLQFPPVTHSIEIGLTARTQKSVDHGFDDFFIGLSFTQDNCLDPLFFSGELLPNCLDLFFQLGNLSQPTRLLVTPVSYSAGLR